MTIEGKNFRSITPQQKLMKVVERMGEAAIANTEDPTAVAAIVERFTKIAESLSIPQAEEILKKINE